MDIGGSERAALLLADHLKANGDSVLFFFLRRGGKSFVCPYESHCLGYKHTDGSQIGEIKGILEAASKLRAYKKRYRIDVAISFMEQSNFINILSKRKERVIVSTRTTLSSRDDLKGIVYSPTAIKWLYNRAYRVVAVSDYTRDDLLKNYGIGEKKAVTISNISTKEPFEYKGKWLYGDETVIHVGRLDPVKQQDRIIRAFSYLHSLRPNARLIILGDGKIRRYLRMICEKMNVRESVSFLGFKENVGYYLANSKIFVMASRAEGFPNAMVEAMAYGLPIVTADSFGGVGEIVGKKYSYDETLYCEYGILTPGMTGKADYKRDLDKNEILLGEAMNALISDKNLYQRYSQKSKERSEYYSPKNIWKKWDEIIYMKG